MNPFWKRRQKKTGRAVTEARMTGRLRGCEEGDKRPPQGRGRVDGSSEVQVREGEVKVRDLVKKSSELLKSSESALIEKP